MEIARVFLNVSMSYSFNGLSKILRDNKINPETMDKTKFIVFVNSNLTAFKVMVGPHFLVYHSNGRRRFPLEAIQHFPEFFDGKRIDFSAAARKVIKQKFTHEYKG